MEDIKKNIMEYLIQDARMSIKDIAKKIKKERHIVAYHKTQMAKNKVILNNELILNFEALGYNEFIIYLKVFQYSKIKKKIVLFLSKHPNVRWAAEVFPTYNLRISILSKHINEFENIMDEIENICEGKVIRKEVLFGRELIKKENYGTKHSKLKTINKSVTLNDKDKKLIKELTKDSTQKLLTLATKTDQSIECVRSKIKQFQSVGLISGFTVKFDLLKAGINFRGQLFLKINNIDDNMSKLQSLVYSKPYYGRTRKVFGSWNVEMTLMVESYKQMTNIINDLENSFGDDLKDYQLQITTKKITSQLPKIIFDS